MVCKLSLSFCTTPAGKPKEGGECPLYANVGRELEDFLLLPFRGFDVGDEWIVKEKKLEEVRATYLVVFGAAVRPNGLPSGTLERRVRFALDESQRWDVVRFILSGGVGKFGPSEASVMKRLLLEAGIGEEQIILDEDSNDTLSSGCRIKELLEYIHNVERVVVCSSSYHIPRCRMLLKIFGIKSEAAMVASDRRWIGWGKWFYYTLREGVAIPYDFMAAIICLLRS